jgi:hypothetical protein
MWFVPDVALSLMVLSTEDTKTQETRMCYLVVSGTPLDLKTPFPYLCLLLMLWVFYTPSFVPLGIICVEILTLIFTLFVSIPYNSV